MLSSAKATAAAITPQPLYHMSLVQSVVQVCLETPHPPLCPPSCAEYHSTLVGEGHAWHNGSVSLTVSICCTGETSLQGLSSCRLLGTFTCIYLTAHSPLIWNEHFSRWTGHPPPFRRHCSCRHSWVFLTAKLPCWVEVTRACGINLLAGSGPGTGGGRDHAHSTLRSHWHQVRTKKWTTCPLLQP